MKPERGRLRVMGQHNAAPWDDVETALRGIFERRYFANNGPLVRRLDREFAAALGVAHAVCVANETVAVMIAAKALDLHGTVIVPAIGAGTLRRGLAWAGLETVAVDIDPASATPSESALEHALTPDTTAVAGVHLWGSPCAVRRLETFGAEHRLAVLFDASSAALSSVAGRRVGGFGDAEIFSFNARHLLNGGEGGCITTNDAAAADAMRTIRNFHASETFAPAALRMNGKMSEAQAALVLLALAHAETWQAANDARRATYAQELAGLAGLTLHPLGAGGAEVHLHVDSRRANDRDDLRAALQASGIETAIELDVAGEPGAFPAAEALARETLELPNGDGVTSADIAFVAGVIRSASGAGAPIGMGPA